MNDQVKGMVRQHHVTPSSRVKPNVVPLKGKNPQGSRIPVKPPTQALSKNNRKKNAQGKQITKKRIYVLDTNVLMHDPMCLFHFQEHDISIPYMVLEELDNHKQGHDDKNRHARQVSRTIENLFSTTSATLDTWVSLEDVSHGQATGKLSVQAEIILEKGTKPDNVILESVKRLKASSSCEVVLVSKDINMRLKARTMGLLTEDYKTDTIEAKDGDYFHPGFIEMPQDFWDRHGENLEAKSGAHGSSTYSVHGKDVKDMYINQALIERVQHGKPKLFRVTKKDGLSASLSSMKNYTANNATVYGIHAKNIEQSIALNFLMDPEIHIVSLAGSAGTGKTILALAAGLEQVMEQNMYSEVIFTRATVSVGDEIGFLPGTEEEKMLPWLGALYDNLEVLGKKSHSPHDSKHNPKHEQTITSELMKRYVKIHSMSFVRGRSFFKKFIIVDEVQNLTPKQVKTLVTRAGEGTKMVLLGNISQIDTPYLTEGSCGLTHVVKNFKGWSRSGHITLPKGERSELANHANQVL